MMERMMDTIARDLGRDRVELRLQNMLTPAELPRDRGTASCGPGRLRHRRLRRLPSRARGDDRADPGIAPPSRGPRDRGQVLGLGICLCRGDPRRARTESAVVRVDGAGKVTVLTGASPHGQGHGHVGPDRRRRAGGRPGHHRSSTATPTWSRTAWAPTPAATRSWPAARSRSPSRQVRAKALTLAAHLLEVTVDDLESPTAHSRCAARPASLIAGGAGGRRQPRTDRAAGMEPDLLRRHYFQAPLPLLSQRHPVAVVEVDARPATRDPGLRLVTTRARGSTRRWWTARSGRGRAGAGRRADGGALLRRGRPAASARSWTT